MYEALTLGYAAPHTDFDATLHSVFYSAVNLLPLNGDLPLTLVTVEKHSCHSPAT